MEDRSAVSVGVVLAGVAIVGAAFPWGTAGWGPFENVVVAALGAVAFGAFTLRRHDRLGRTAGSLLAGAASLAVVGYALATTAGLFAQGSTPEPSPVGVGLALVGGLGGAVAAYGDGRGFSGWTVRAARATGWGLAVGFAGLFAIALWASVLVNLVASVIGVPGAAQQLVLGAVALGLGTGTVAVAYFRLTDRTLAFLDVRVPDRRDVGYVVGGVVALLVLQWTLAVVLQQLGISTASHSVEQAARGSPDVLLLLVPASWLVIGPGEELLYRNIIQKSLYDTFGGWGAVLVGSIVFALAHIPAYGAGASPTSLAVTLVVIFALSLVLGATYLRTGNLTVSVLIHGTFDAIVFVAMYVQMTGGM